MDLTDSPRKVLITLHELPDTGPAGLEALSEALAAMWPDRTILCDFGPTTTCWEAA